MPHIPFHTHPGFGRAFSPGRLTLGFMMPMARLENGVPDMTGQLVDRLQHLMPSFGGGDVRLRIGLPDERLRLLVMDVDEGVDGALQVDKRMEHAALRPPAGELGE